MTDLTADICHHAQGGAVEEATLVAEEHDHTGHLPPVGHGKGKLGVETGMGE